MIVEKALLAVAADPQSKIAGQPDPELTYESSGFQFDDTAEDVLSG